MRVERICTVLRPFDFFPFLLRKLRECHITLHFRMHSGEVHTVCKGKCETIDLATANDEGLSFLYFLRTFNRLLNGRNNFTTNDVQTSLPRDNDVPAFRERPANGLVVLPPHDDGVPLRLPAKEFEIVGEIPRQRIVTSDDIVLRDGNDERYSHSLRIRE